MTDKDINPTSFFRNNENWKQMTRDLCAEGYPQLAVYLNVKIKDLVDAHDQLQSRVKELSEENERLWLILDELNEGLSSHLEDLQHYFENKCIPTVDEVNQFCVMQSKLLLEITRRKALSGKDGEDHAKR